MSSYLVIGTDLAVMALLASWMFVTSRTHYLFRACAAVIIVGLSVHLWMSANALRGYAVPGLPPDRSEILGFVLKPEHMEIYFWVVDHDLPRSFVTPYTK